MDPKGGWLPVRPQDTRPSCHVRPVRVSPQLRQSQEGPGDRKCNVMDGFLTGGVSSDGFPERVHPVLSSLRGEGRRKSVPLYLRPQSIRVGGGGRSLCEDSIHDVGTMSFTPGPWSS